MTDPINLDEHRRNSETTPLEHVQNKITPHEGLPSNPVYARVGDVILEAARDGVRRNLPARDIVREILADHQVHLNVGELRLLLASRRIPVTQAH